MQKIHVAMIVTMFLSAPPHGRTQTTADSLSIAKTALNYIEGWYEGNAERMKQSLHPKLAKRRVFVDHETGKTKTQHLSAWHMIMGTRFGGGKATVREDRKNEIIILDIIENNASVKAVSADFIDYLHLARYDGQWRIVNVLWELRQEINQEAGSAVLLLILIVIIVLSPVLVWPIGFFIRSFRSGKATSFIRSLPPKYPTIARCLILLTIFAFAMFIFFGNGYWYILSVILLLGAMASTIFVWKNRTWSPLGRIYYSFIVILALLCILGLYSLFPLSL